MNDKNLFVTVNYFSNKDLLEYLNSLVPQVRKNDKIIILNNCSNQNHFDFDHRNVIVFNKKENLGYFGGIKHVLDKTEKLSYDKIIISNPDIKFHEDFTKNLEETSYDWDILAPAIYNSDGINQNPHRLKKPNLYISLFLKIYFSNYIIYSFLKLLLIFRKKKSVILNQKIKIFSCHGAIMILNNSFFKKGGEIQNHFFLYGEEDSIAGQSALRGLNIIYDPKFIVDHNEKSSTSKLTSIKKFKFQKKAYMLNHKKYGKNLFQL